MRESANGPLLSETDTCEAWAQRIHQQSLSDSEVDTGQHQAIANTIQKLREQKVSSISRGNHKLPPHITIPEIHHCAKTLKSTNAITPEYILRLYVFLLISNYPQFVCSLMTIVLWSTTVPSCWKKVVIDTRHKRGPIDVISSWRIIMIASAFYMVFQKLVEQRERDDIRNAYLDVQHGYRFDALEHTINLDGIVKLRAAHGLPTSGLCADLRHAYPRAWRQFLMLLITEKLDLSPFMWLLFHSWLQPSTAIIPGLVRKYVIIKNGLLEGEILAPLFYCFLADLCLQRMLIRRLGVFVPGTHLQNGLFLPGLVHADDQFWLGPGRPVLIDQAGVAESWEEQSGGEYHVGEEKTVLIDFQVMITDASTKPSVVLNNTTCRNATVKKYLGVLIDHKLEYNRNFEKLLNTMTQCSMRLAIWAAANELPWSVFLDQLWTTVLSKAYYHALNIIMCDDWAAQIDSVPDASIQRALNIPPWRTGVRIRATTFGKWRWSTHILQNVIRRRAMLDLIENRPTAHIWSAAHNVPGTLAQVSLGLAKMLGCPSIHEWASTHQINLQDVSPRKITRSYMISMNNYFSHHENVYMARNYPTGSMIDLASSSCILAQRNSAQALSWIVQFCIKDWLRLKLGCIRPTKSKACALCQCTTTSSWNHILNTCSQTVDIRQKLNATHAIGLQDITQLEHMENLDSTIVFASTLTHRISKTC